VSFLPAPGTVMASQARLRRLIRLIDLLGAGRAYRAEELARLCGVSRRTIFRDLATLRDSGLSIWSDEDRQGFLLDRPSYLKPVDLTVPEALSMLVLCDKLAESRNGIPLQSAARSAALKILTLLPLRLRRYVEVVEQVHLRVGPVNPLQGASSTYDLLTRAFDERRQVRIRYDSFFEKKEIRTLLSPYRLLFHTRSWYVVGRSSLHRAVRTFNLGRVLHAELAESHYEVPPRFTLERYFGNAWSIIRDRGDRHEVTIRFRPMVARNVAEVQWHRTQRLSWNDDGTLDFTATVEGLREIVWWVLRYGKEATVLRPAKLRTMVREQVAAIAGLYGEAEPA
jgi:proteasome accessory factor B